MTIGQKRPPVTDEQRRAFDAKLKKDAMSFFTDLVKPAVAGAADHIKRHPESFVTQVAKEPFVVAVAVHGLRAVGKLYDENEMKAAAEAAEAQRRSDEAAAAARKAKVVDAEFIEDPPAK